MSRPVCDQCKGVELDPSGACPVCGWKPPQGGWADPPEPSARPPAPPPTPRPAPGQGSAGASVSDAVMLAAIDVLAASLPTEDGFGDAETLVEIARIADDLVLSGMSTPHHEPLGDVCLRHLSKHNYASAWTMFSIVARDTRLGRILGNEAIVEYFYSTATPGSVVIVVSWEGTTQLSIYPESVDRRVLFRVMSTDVPHFRGIDAIRASKYASVPATKPVIEPGGARGVVSQLKGEWL